MNGLFEKRKGLGEVYVMMLIDDFLVFDIFVWIVLVGSLLVVVCEFDLLLLVVSKWFMYFEL